MFNTYDIFGGAAKATSRLFKGLRKIISIHINYVVKYKSTDYSNVSLYNTKIMKRIYNKICTGINNRVIKWTRSKNSCSAAFPFNTDIMPSFDKGFYKLDADIVHLNWICNGHISLDMISKIKSPIIWTLHDSWAFTGGCHITFDCTRYMEGCGKCPQLSSESLKDISYKLLKKKHKKLSDKDITIVTPSNWLADCARKSSLFRNRPIYVIPNGLDTEVFKPIQKSVAREVWGLPLDKKLILFGAMNSVADPNKGYKYLQAALEKLNLEKWSDGIELVVFGANNLFCDELSIYKTNVIGSINDEQSLAVLYNACDVMIVPSISESFGQTAVESMACGTPVVAFRATGLLDIIDHKESGYLAKAYEPDDLASGIRWVLEDEKRWRSLSNNSRKKVLENYNIDVISQRYFNLYKKICEKT